jgi:ferritin
MLKSNIQEAFNRQVNAELYSSYLYLSMAAYFESQSFSGMAQWMRYQAQEEHLHAMKFYDFIHERNGRVTLGEIAAPKIDWDSSLNGFEEALAHEQMITGCINDLADLALAEKDHATNSFLQWFINEQVEEESTVQAILDKLHLVGDNGVALFMVDQELGQRPAPAVVTGSAT